MNRTVLGITMVSSLMVNMFTINQTMRANSISIQSYKSIQSCNLENNHNKKFLFTNLDKNTMPKIQLMDSVLMDIGESVQVHVDEKNENKQKSVHKKEKNESYKEYDVPTHNGFKSYEDGDCITRSLSMPEGRMHSKYVLDTDSGIWTVDDRFCIAVGSYYTTKIGTKIDLVMQSGKIVKCIIADCKADKDTNSANQRHNSDGSVTEFIVNSNCLKKNMYKNCKTNTGNVEDVCNDLKGEISKFRIYN